MPLPGGAPLARKLTVASGAACADRGDFSPDAALERRALRCQRDVETELGIVEIAFELPAGALGNAVPRRERSAARLQEHDFGETSRGRADPEQAERRRQFRLEVSRHVWHRAGIVA